MTTAAKLKVSLTLSADLVALVDRDAKRRNGTRSGVIEQWLRGAASAAVAQELDAATAAYYRSLRPEEAEEDEALSRALSGAARKLAFGDAVAPRRRRAPR